jgi:hypothetical protein
MTTFTLDDASTMAGRLGLDLEREEFDLDALMRGMNVELEHGTRSPETDVTGDDPLVTARIALAHLREMPDYYERLDEMERLAEAEAAVASDSDAGIV